MLDKIPHYSLTNPASIYNEEALTALELAGRTAAKVNEAVNAFNELEENTDKKLSEQDEFIDTMNAVTMPKLVKDTVKEHIDDGEFDDAIDEYAGNLETRLDNLVGSLPTGSTTMDAEIVDARLGADDTIYKSIGEAVRVENKLAQRQAIWVENTYTTNEFASADVINIDTTNFKITFPHATIIYLGEKQITYQSPVIDYSLITKNSFYIVVPIKREKISGVWYLTNNGNPIAIERENYDASKHAILFVMVKPTPYYLKRGISPLYPAVRRFMVNNVFYSGYENNAKYAHKIFVKDKMLQFDTSSKNVSLTETLLCCYGSMEFSITPFTASYDIGDNTVYLVWNLNSKTAHLIKPADYLPGEMVVVMQFQTNYLTTPTAQNIGAPYLVDGREYGASASSSNTPSVIVKGNETVYVDGVNGNDANTGEAAAPFKSIQKAIDSGASNIYITPGTYKEKLTASNRASLNLTAFPSGKVIIDGGTYFTDNTVVYDISSNGYQWHKLPYTPAANSNAAKVVNGELDNIIPGERSNGYYIKVYDSCDTIDGTFISEHETFCKTLEEVEGQMANGYNLFYYSDGYLYVPHDTGINSTNVCVVDSEYGASFENIGSLTLKNINFIHTVNDTASIKNCPDVKVLGCEFNNSNAGNGLKLENVSGEISLCKAINNCNDGFNLHGSGYTVFVNCTADKNDDDGVSHHDNCHGVINGGSYTNNGKAGIAPTYKAIVDINNVYINHNYTYGVLASDPDGDDNNSNIPLIHINSCHITNCKTGVYARNYNVMLFNTTLSSNTIAQTATANNGSINEQNVIKES